MCLRGGLPIIKEDKKIKNWNMIKMTKKYLNSCQSEFWKEVFEKELEYASKELQGYKDILSVGCGPAIIERGLIENGFNVTGLDVSKEALEGAPDDIRTIVGSAEQMNIPDSSYDAVIYIASLQFIENYASAVEETSRVLRPDGKLVVLLLNPESEFFEQKTENPESYVNRIKRREAGGVEKVIFKEIEEVIRKYFSVQKAEYYLGIKGKQVFDTQDQKLASLYIISGVKK